MVTLTLEDVEARVAEVEHTLARLEIATTYYRKYRDELQTLKRVLPTFGEPVERLFGDVGTLLAGTAQPAAEAVRDEAREEAKPVKPSNIPTMPEMIVEVLEAAKVMDEGPLEPKEIAGRIRARWWADAPTTSVGPIAWRMAKDHRLSRIGSAYALPEDETPAGDTAGASEPQEGVGDADLFFPTPAPARANPSG